MKKLRTIIVLLAVTIGSGLFAGSQLPTSYIATNQPIATQPVVNQPTIFQGDDDLQPLSQQAKVIINAQKTAEIGELIRFDLSESTAQSFKWLRIPETVDFETYGTDNRFDRAVFSARKSGEYLFIVACAYDGTVDIAKHIVIVEGPVAPIMPPNIDAGLGQWVAYWCLINDCPKDEAAKLAGSFENIAAQIAAGVLQEADDIVEATAEANREALGNSLQAWLPVLRELQTRMKIQAEQGALTTPDQHRDLWLEIAEGLHHYTR